MRSEILCFCLLTAILAATGCDDVQYGSASGRADAGLDPPPENGLLCETDRDCPDGGFCVGPAGCDAQWFCQSENPCSAVAPPLYCGCDGTVFSANAGCPGQKFAGFVESNVPIDDFAACDPDNPGNFRFDLTLEGEGFDAFEGQVVRARLQDTVIGMTVYEDTRFIENGVFVFDWRDAFNPDHFGYFIDFFISPDGAGECRPGASPSWRAFANNDFDSDAAHIVVRVSPEDPQDREVCERW